VFCSKEKVNTANFIDGVNYDPFYAEAEEYGQGLQL
jgi:hypothetical protein